ncbi:MAG: type II toxin-antitoxin system VapC family toxin [bacterium]
MEQKYLIDTNILIYSLKGLFIKNEKMQEIFDKFFNISDISEIELLGWKDASFQDIMDARSFLSYAYIHPLTKEIKDLTIKIKQKNNIKLGDAIIAATAIYHNCILITRNTKDFEKIEDLELYNPFE